MFGDAKVPELMLEHDGHLLRVLVPQALRQAYARKFGAEGDVEMVLARQPVLAGVHENLAHDSLQRLLHE
jgi:hypothetical protein